MEAKTNSDSFLTESCGRAPFLTVFLTTRIFYLSVKKILENGTVDFFQEGVQLSIRIPSLLDLFMI